MITDFKYAFRMLLKAPGFTCIAVLTLALGIGANSAIFSVADAVLLRPLPFKNPEQLVMIWGSLAREPQAKMTGSFPDFYDYRAQSQSFSSMAAFSRGGAILSGAGEPQELHGLAANGDIFRVMDVQSDDRSRIHCGGGEAGPAGRGRARARLMAARLWQQSKYPRSAGLLFRSQIDGHRSHAAGMEIPGRCGVERIHHAAGTTRGEECARNAARYSCASSDGSNLA